MVILHISKYNVYCLPYISMCMTAVDKARVEGSEWIVRAVVNRLNPNDDDLFQSIYLYLCKCVERFDEERGTKWSTYAFKSAYYYGLMFLKREARMQCQELTEDILADESVEEDIEIKELLGGLMNKLTHLQQKIVKLKYEGYKNNEIRKALGLGKNSYFRELKEIHQVARTMRG